MSMYILLLLFLRSSLEFAYLICIICYSKLVQINFFVKIYKFSLDSARVDEYNHTHERLKIWKTNGGK